MRRFDLHFTEAEARALTDRLSPEALRGVSIGAACAGFQCEGGYNGPGQPRNNWAGWEGRPGVVASGGACRFWERYGEDAALLAGSGLQTFRMSLEWARIEPKQSLNGEGEPDLDRKAIDHYAQILKSFVQVGIEPLLTLYHWTHPSFLGSDFWLDDGAPERFAAYLRAMLPKLLDALDALATPAPRRFITLNEPNMFALATYLAGRFPHHLQGSDAARRCLENQLLAHLRAVQVVREIYAARGLAVPSISFNNNFSALYRLDALFVDLLLAPQAKVARRNLDEHLHAREKELTRTMLESEGAIAGLRMLLRWAFRKLEGIARSQLNAKSFPRLIDAVYSYEGAPLDYLAFDYYDPFPWNILGRSTMGNDRGFGPVVDEWDWKPHPRGLSAALSFYSQAAPGLPIILAENGMAARAVGQRTYPRADGARRDLFIQAHLYELFKALADGVPAQGYLHWSLWDNYEWGSYQPRFGLIGIDAVGDRTERALLDAHGVPALASLSAIAKAARSGDRPALAAALSARPDS